MCVAALVLQRSLHSLDETYNACAHRAAYRDMFEVGFCMLRLQFFFWVADPRFFTLMNNKEAFLLIFD